MIRATSETSEAPTITPRMASGFGLTRHKGPQDIASAGDVMNEQHLEYGYLGVLVVQGD